MKVPLLASLTFAGLAGSQTGDTAQPTKLVIGKLPAESVTSVSSGRSWRLGGFNQTSRIEAAYLYHEKVIVFGWIGCCANVTTIIDAAAGTEQLEFLEQDPHLTPEGIIVFRRFYPHFSDPSIISDTIDKLDLNRPVPRSVPTRANENPTDQVGLDLYPQTVTPGVRHLIEHNFLITDAGRLLFVADRLSSGELCLVRLSISDPPDRTSKENCTTSASFEASSLSELHIRQFAENTFGDLVLSVDIGEPNAAAHRDFDIDKTSLTITPIPVKETRESENFPIPWSVQREALTFFVPLRLTAESNEVVKVRVAIDTKGGVSDVSVSGSPTGLSELVKHVVSQWRFKPTILDGRQIGVITAFTTPVRDLGQIPN